MNSTMFVPRCGLCGKSGRLTKTDCCDNWICDDEAEYMMFSFATNSCYRNHDRYTLCSNHYNEKHGGADWRTCKECYNMFDPQTYNWYGTNEFNFVTLTNPPTLQSHSDNIRGQSSGNRIRTASSKRRTTSSKRGKSAKPRATSKRAKSQTKGKKKPKQYNKITSATIDSSIREEVKSKFGKSQVLPSLANQRETSNRQKSVSKRGRPKNQKPEQKVEQNSRQRGRSKASSKRTSSSGQTKSTQRKSQSRRGKSNRRTSSNLASLQSQRKSRHSSQPRGKSVNTTNRKGTSRSQSKTNKKPRKSTKKKPTRMWVRTSSPQNRGSKRGASRSQSNRKRGNSTKRRVVRGVWVRSSTPKKTAPRTMWTWYLPGLLPNSMWTVVPSKNKKKDKKQTSLSNSRSQPKKGKVNKKRKANSILEDANIQPLGGTLIKMPIKRIKKNEEEDFDAGREESLRLVTLTGLKMKVVLPETKDDVGERSDVTEDVIKKKVSGIRKKMNIEKQLEVSSSEEKIKLGTTFIDN